MSLYLIASEENLNHLAHYGIKGMKWGNKKGVLDKIYEDSAKRANTRHYVAGSVFDWDDKTKKSFWREYKGTTKEGGEYKYNLLKDKFEYVVRPKGNKKWSKTKKKVK